MNIVRLTGGLGNQMFQYALYLSLKQTSDVKIDVSSYESYNMHNGYQLNEVFNLNPPLADSIERLKFGVCSYRLFDALLHRVMPKKRQVERIYKSFDQSILRNGIDKYYDGYWQSWKYFYPIRELILSHYKFPSISGYKNISLSEIIYNNYCVSVHIRRGDYINHPLHGEVCDLGYYERAIEYVRSKEPNSIFVIFSNDLDWCREKFRGYEFIYSDHNIGKDNFIDMHLMSLCSANIIANSSFSWWGAYLGSDGKKMIIAPNRWYKNMEIPMDDILPPQWIRL